MSDDVESVESAHREIEDGFAAIGLVRAAMENNGLTTDSQGRVIVAPERGAVTGRIRYYRHPQGAYITVFPDGSMDVRKPDGKKKKTSATAENLRAGHGAWQEVASLDDSTILPTPEEIHAQQMAAVPDRQVHREPDPVTYDGRHRAEHERDGA